MRQNNQAHEFKQINLISLKNQRRELASDLKTRKKTYETTIKTNIRVYKYMSWIDERLKSYNYACNYSI